MAGRFLPEELIEGILSRATVKFLVRMMAVSKSWFTRITSSFFTSLQLENAQSHKILIIPAFDSVMMIYEIDWSDENNVFIRKISEIPLDFSLRDDTDSGIVGTIDGLICLRVGENDFYIVNPSFVSQLREVPRCPSLVMRENRFFMFPKTLKVAFAWDSCNKDYKIVLLVAKNKMMKAWVYSFKRNSWVCVHEGPGDFEIVRVPPRGVFLNDTVHFLINCNNEIVVASLNVNNNEFLLMECPVTVGVLDFHNLGVLNNCLCMMELCTRLRCDGWIMKEYGKQESWEKFQITGPKNGNDRIRGPHPMRDIHGTHHLSWNGGDWMLTGSELYWLDGGSMRLKNVLVNVSERKGKGKDNGKVEVNRLGYVNGAVTYKESLIGPAMSTYESAHNLSTPSSSKTGAEKSSTPPSSKIGADNAGTKKEDVGAVVAEREEEDVEAAGTENTMSTYESAHDSSTPSSSKTGAEKSSTPPSSKIGADNAGTKKEDVEAVVAEKEDVEAAGTDKKDMEPAGTEKGC